MYYLNDFIEEFHIKYYKHILPTHLHDFNMLKTNMNMLVNSYDNTIISCYIRYLIYLYNNTCPTNELHQYNSEYDILFHQDKNIFLFDISMISATGKKMLYRMIKNIVSVRILNFDKRYIFIKNFSLLPTNLQIQFKQIFETNTTYFILFSSKATLIEESIRSRFGYIRIPTPSEEQIIAAITELVSSKQVKYLASKLNKLISIHNRDIGLITHHLRYLNDNEEPQHNMFKKKLYDDMNKIMRVRQTNKVIQGIRDIIKIFVKYNISHNLISNYILSYCLLKTKSMQQKHLFVNLITNGNVDIQLASKPHFIYERLFMQVFYYLKFK